MPVEPTIITVSMGANGPVVTPNTAKVPRNGKVQWVAADDSRWWAVVMKGGKTPFPNNRKTFKGKKQPSGSKFKGTVKKGQTYDYWILYQDAQGEPHVKDPRLVIRAAVPHAP